MAALVANDECNEKVILDFCAKINKGAAFFHLDQRVLWFCLSNVKTHVSKKHWGTGVDVLKLAGQKGNLKEFILKIFASQNYHNYGIEVGNRSVLGDVQKVSNFNLFFWS